MNVPFTPGRAVRRPWVRRALVVTVFTPRDELVAVKVAGMYLCEYLDDPSVPLMMRASEVHRHVAALGGAEYTLEVMDWL